MDWEILAGLDWASLIDWLSDNVDDSSESWGSNWDHDGISSIKNLLSSNETLSGVKSNSSNIVSSEMLGNLEDESVVNSLNFEGVKNWWEVSLELDIHNGTNDLGDLSKSGLSSAEPSY